MANSLVNLLLAAGASVRLVPQQDRRQRPDRRRVRRGGRRTTDRIQDTQDAASGTQGGFGIGGDEDGEEGGGPDRR
jgi:hypothetical protein